MERGLYFPIPGAIKPAPALQMQSPADPFCMKGGLPYCDRARLVVLELPNPLANDRRTRGIFRKGAADRGIGLQKSHAGPVLRNDFVEQGRQGNHRAFGRKAKAAQSLEMLDCAHRLPGRSGLQKPFAHNALNKALNGVNIPIDPFTIHDLRRTGSTRLHEAGFASDVIEKALNHTIGAVRGIYNRAGYASQRSEMLQFWADFVDALANEKKVILGNFGLASCTPRARAASAPKGAQLNARRVPASCSSYRCWRLWGPAILRIAVKIGPAITRRANMDAALDFIHLVTAHARS
jgi:hypothetical protein